MNEQDLIRLVTSTFRRDTRQKNNLFECDAEILELNGQLWALTLDQFSPKEDLFTSDDPEKLGSNLVVATLSDLYAAGAKPEFFLQGLVVPKKVDSSFVRGLSEGIQKVFIEANCSLCGGDIGTDEDWRFTGFAMGRVRNNRPLTRVLPHQSHSLWVTGNMGDANLAALEGGSTPRFELRNKEAEVVHKYATACIDTSGGFIETLWWLHTLNPTMRFEIDIEQVPLATKIIEASIRARLPAEAFLLGGAGEYELTFTIAEPISSNIEEAMNSIRATRVGAAYPDMSRTGISFQRDGKIVSVMKNALPCPREAKNRDSYIRSLVQISKELFGAHQ